VVPHDDQRGDGGGAGDGEAGGADEQGAGEPDDATAAEKATIGPAQQTTQAAAPMPRIPTPSLPVCFIGPAP
jgi:hypothetical protein